MRQVTFVLAAVLFAVVSGCTDNYSEGYRFGVIQKFSRKGLIWKTYEGELVLPGMKMTSSTDKKGVASTTMTNLFEFSLDGVPSHGENTDILARQLEAAMLEGKPVRVKYVEIRCICPQRGDTPYMITDVMSMER